MSKGQKGKIPIREWPNITARHQQGETLASIARAYGCTPPAIAYILRRAADTKADGNGASHSDGEVGGIRIAARRHLDPRLRERMHSDISAFLVAFDAACSELTGDTGAHLLEATDRLLRAAARTRIELERFGWT